MGVKSASRKTHPKIDPKWLTVEEAALHVRDADGQGNATPFMLLRFALAGSLTLSTSLVSQRCSEEIV
jgi:hypothetical protein